jgi:signal peptidase I
MSSEPRSWRSSILELLKTLIVVLVLVVAMRAYVVEAYVIQGASMEPTFHESERLLVSKFAPRFDELKRGDIVIFEHPDTPGKRVIKRVVGLPGETIRIESGRVYVNEVLLDEPYLQGYFDNDYRAAERIEPGRYFVLGDNRARSNDSRSMGTIPVDSIVGKAFVLFYPKFHVF